MVLSTGNDDFKQECGGMIYQARGLRDWHPFHFKMDRTNARRIFQKAACLLFLLSKDRTIV
jgi:hypothetical protein